MNHSESNDLSLPSLAGEGAGLTAAAGGFDPATIGEHLNGAPPGFRALIISRDKEESYPFSEALSDRGWEVETHTTLAPIREQLVRPPWTFVICPAEMPDGTAMEVLEALSSRIRNDLSMVLVTQDREKGSAAETMKLVGAGAEDYLYRNIETSTVANFAETARQRAQIVLDDSEEGRGVPGEVREQKKEHDLIGRSPAIIALAKMISKYAKTNLSCLVVGESGTGKEVIARHIHQQSTRAAKPFVSINCGAFSEDLLESELFGHLKGSFTGAAANKTGLWEAANGGTIFLDEVTETTPAFQVKLLRVLAEGEIRPIGSNITKTVSVRVIAASNRNVLSEIKAGRFREDLYHRLNEVQFPLPPLRERREDIDLLIDHFMRKSGATAQLSPEARKALNRYGWPGNVRELRTAVDRLMATAKTIINVDEIPTRIIGHSASEMAFNYPIFRLIEIPEEWVTLDQWIDFLILKTFEKAGKNKTKAASLLGMNIKTYRHYLNEAMAREDELSEKVVDD